MSLEVVTQQLPILGIISLSTFDLLGRDQLGPAAAPDAAAVINGVPSPTRLQGVVAEP